MPLRRAWRLDADQLAGQTGADIAHAGRALFDPFLDSIFDHINDDVSHAGHGHQVWASGMVGTDAVSGNTALGSQRLRSNITGFAGGADFSVGPRVTVGGAFSLGANNFRVANGLGTGKVDAIQLGVYGDMQFTHRIYGSFAGVLGLDNIKTDRVLTVSGTDELTGKVNGIMAGGRYGNRRGYGMDRTLCGDPGRIFRYPGL